MKPVKTITEAQYKAKVLAHNRAQATIAPGISINPYNYASRFGMAQPTAKRIQVTTDYYRYPDFEDLDENGNPKMKIQLDDAGNRLVKGKKVIKHY